MAERTRSFDWSSTSVGAIEHWPDALLITVNTLLASSHPMFLWWGNDLIQFYNDAYRPSIGFDRHPSALGQAGPLCWPEIWPIIQPQIEGVMSRGEATWHEDQLVPILRDGVLRDVYWTYGYTPVRDTDGVIRGILVTSLDTTRSVLAAHALHASRAQYKTIFESASDAIFVADAMGSICEVNLAACSLLEYPAEDLIGMTYADLVAPAEIPRLWKVRDRLQLGGSIVTEWQLLTRKGAVLVTEVSATVLPDGRWQAFVRDITVRKSLERERLQLTTELQRQRSRFADLFHQAPAFVAVLRGPRHVFEITNPRYDELVGQRDVVGKSVLEAIPEAAAQGFVAILDKVYATGEPVVGHASPFQLAPASPSTLAQNSAANLEQRYVDFVYQPMRETDGSISGIIVLGVDVTERERAQQMLIQTEKLAAVGRLATSIAHEINNPLEAVTNLLYLVENTSEREERHQYLKLAQSELGRVADITTQTLRFHRQSTNASPTCLSDVVESVLTLMHGRLLSMEVSVETRFHSHREITAFEGDLRQVFANLVANAIDATRRGDRIILSVRDSRNPATGAPGVTVTVADTGCGMPEKTRLRIFEPFFTTKGLTGTGLGLWVSAAILQRHQATIRVRSSQDPVRHGTVFSTFFPLNAAATR